MLVDLYDRFGRKLLVTGGASRRKKTEDTDKNKKPRNDGALFEKHFKILQISSKGPDSF
jgi:hypothetical protein